MQIKYAKAALKDLRDIEQYIAQDRPRAAKQVISRIEHVVRKNLPIFPELGRVWQNGPTRGLPIAGMPYRVHYKIENEELIILRVMHTSRMPPVV